MAKQKDGTRKSTSGVDVFIPSAGKGDNILTFKSTNAQSKLDMETKLDEIKKGGQLMSLNRGGELQQIFGYSAANHSWLLGSKSAGEQLKYKKGDEVHVISPLAGG